MNDDFRQRVFLPVLMPLGVILGFFGFAFMLSRVLLAVPEMASTTIALGLATYVLVVAAMVAAKPRITSRALAVGVTLGIVAVVGAGVLAAGAGMREVEHAAAEGDEPAPAEGAGGGTEPPAEADATEGGDAAEGLAFTAVDIEFTSAPTGTVPAGELEVVLVNEGQTLHNVTIPALGDSPIVEAEGGEEASGSVTLEPGTYQYICSVPGHESLMNGEFTAE